MNKINPIISPDIYNKSSLLDDITYLSNKKNEISEYMIINMIIKYIFGYYYLDSINLKIHLNEITKFFNTLNFISNKKLEKHEINQNTDKIEGFYHSQEYSLRMAMDIASTTKIVKDIISRVIDSKKFDGKYLGVDLGSGIGILTLAQFIQAKRNNFKNINNIGFDLGYFVSKYSKRFLEILNAGTVIHQDTTEIKLFGHIPQYNDITFITNETLCDPYLPITGDRIHSDPFMENNQNLFNNGKVFFNTDTQFFPEEVVVGDRNMGFDYILDKENEFSYTEAGGDKNGTYCFKEISICGDLVKLEEVGNDLIEKGIVSKLPNLTPRWCINR